MVREQAVIRIPQQIWRQAARQHQERIRNLLQPGLTSMDHPLNAARKRFRDPQDWVTALCPKHPVYNFLIEYYGLKGAKGPRRLARWSPSPGLLLQEKTTQIETLDHLEDLSCLYAKECQSRSTVDDRGVLLEGASEEDFTSNLHLRGATIVEKEGVLYSPYRFFGKGDSSRKEENARLSAPFLWYRSILQQTLTAEPIFHCYGLHEWAMQYQPAGAPPPPSAKYQTHLPLRVSREVINETVERKGVSCTHVDALRYFTEDAVPLNQYGGPLERADQARLEQPACVHAHMDLIKMALKLQPFCDPSLLERVLQVGLEARRLDVAASPYDASAYGVGMVPIDTPEGRAEYRTKQKELMERVEPVRRDLLRAYENFIPLAFDDAIIGKAAERLPQAKRQVAH
jgi:hypothetical protein